MKGRVYVFLRKNGAPLRPAIGNGGHVGWGFQLDDGTFYAGATENESGQFNVKPGNDNGWWAKVFVDEPGMCEAMRARNYDAYKMATVREARPQAARATADHTRSLGYTGFFNNCLDHVWITLESYGVQDLPWAQTHPAPNDWFAVFNGEYRNL
jgi:hypothetical protein